MYKIPKIESCNIGGVETYAGETIEEKVNKILTQNEPIADGAQLNYTERKDGVLPQYDVRTDKWDIAQSAMVLANASKIAKSRGLKKPEEPQQNAGQQQNARQQQNAGQQQNAE